MLIQVNHDNHIQGSAGLTQAICAIIEGQLARFGEQITRVEVQLSDETSLRTPARSSRSANNTPYFSPGD